MNLKKIWLLGILFGLVASVLFYYATTKNYPPTSPAENIQTSEKTGSANTSTNDISTIESKKSDSKQLLNIEKGKRAISIPVNNFQSVSGFILPEDHIDIISIMPSPPGQETTPEIVLENIKVLATGSKTEVKAESGTVEEKIAFDIITLEVTPEQGKLLANTSQNGFVTLMLRNKEDNTLSSQGFANTEELKKGGNE